MIIGMKAVMMIVLAGNIDDKTGNNKDIDNCNIDCNDGHDDNTNTNNDDNDYASNGNSNTQ